MRRDAFMHMCGKGLQDLGNETILLQNEVGGGAAIPNTFFLFFPVRPGWKIGDP